MKLLVASDIHNDIEIIYKIISLYEKENPDYVILLGDISDMGELKKGLIGRLTSKINPNKIIIIPGNHETLEMIYELKKKYGIRELHKKYFTIGEIVIAGFGGGDVPIFFIDEWEIKDFLDKLKYISKDKKIILFTHIPPLGAKTSLSISGSKELYKFIKYSDNVILNVHGHIHEAGGLEDRINKAKIINAARNVIIVEI